MSDRIYDIYNLRVTPTMISFDLQSTTIQVALEQSSSKILPHAELEELQIFDLDDDGLGIHWPLLDEDLSIAGLLRSAGREDLIVHNVPSLYLSDDSASGDIKKYHKTVPYSEVGR